MSKYQIRIVERKNEGKSKSYQKIADSGNPKDGGAQYSYVDSGEDYIRESEILSMETENINLPKIINAIIGTTRKRKNNLK